MACMFGLCEFDSIDLSNFDTRMVTDMSDMFKDCGSTNTIYAGDNWDTSNVTESLGMFYYCTNLSGDIPFDSSKTDKTYATTTNGYLTYKAPTNQ